MYFLISLEQEKDDNNKELNRKIRHWGKKNQVCFNWCEEGFYSYMVSVNCAWLFWC